MSGDDYTVLANCPTAQNYLGLVYVFIRTAGDNGRWVQQAVLNGTEKVGGAREGTGLAISFDGCIFWNMNFIYLF